MNLLSLAGTTLIAIALTGCATAPRTIAPDVAAGIKRLGVVSVTADEFTRLYVGVTVFGNEREKKAIAAWNLDKAYEEQIGAAAEQVFGATVVKAAYPVADFARVNALKNGWDAPAYWGPHWDVIEAPVRDWCAANRMDAVLVAAQQKALDPFAGTNQAVAGAGVYSARMMGPSVLHLLSTLSLLDCKTGKVLVTRGLYKSEEGRHRDRLVSLPLPTEVTRMPIPEWTPEVESRLRQDLVDLPRSAWTSTLRAMVSKP
jgi:hypothetical protein